MSFSERFGYVKPAIELGETDLPNSLLSGLWDAISLTFFDEIAHYDAIGRQTRFSTKFSYVSQAVWFHFFKESIDERDQDARRVVQQIRSRFFDFKFFQVYAFIEFFSQLDMDRFSPLEHGASYARFCNLVLEREKSAFRFADTTLVKISDRIELEEIDRAISQVTSLSVKTHIKRAAELYSQRPSPDYRNSIKESISSVEAAVRYVTGERSVGVSRPLKKVSELFSIHPALRDGFEKLYAYTSDEGGIRHSLLDEKEITQADARYMLVSCSAFSNYLVALKLA